jgi:hypothetical protein
VIEWRERLYVFLTSAGTVGRKWSEILHHMERQVQADEIEMELEALWAENKVQRFQVPTVGRKGRTATVWRATTKMLD